MRPSSDLPRRRVLRSSGRRGRIIALVFVVVLVVGVVVARWLARLITDGWWFEVLGHREVLSTVNRARFELGIIGGLVAAALLYLCLFLVDRTPPLEGHAVDDQLVLRYQVLVAEHGLVWRLGLSGLFGLVAGLPLADRWQEWLLLRNAMTFRVADGVYDHDIGFYVFRLPFLSYALDWVFTVLLVVALLSAVGHYLSGSVRLAGPGRASPGVRLHLTVLLVALAAVRAATYWFDRYGLVTSTRGFVRGLGYTDQHHVRPALDLLVLVALTTAVLLVVGLRQRSWRLPVVAASLWAVVAVVAGSLYPAIVQRVVSNDEPALRERAGIQRNLAATRAAFGLDGVGATTEPLRTSSDPASAEDLASLADVRLLSASVAARTLGLSATAPPHADGSPSQPDVGLYRVGDDERQVYVGVPSVDPGSRETWQERHRVDVSTAGPVLLDASAVEADGSAVWPMPDGALSVRAGPMYVSEGAGSFAIVATGGTPGPPLTLAAVPLSSFGKRAAFALRFADPELLQGVEDDDRIVYVRSVADRVRTLAPFLSWDSDPYAVIADGRVQWVVDGYTTTDAYPSAEGADVSGLAPSSGLRHPFNYVRNSVKAVVDAHDGSVKLYVVDDADPVLTAWRSAFPRLFDPWSELSPRVKTQLRYPGDLMRVQAAMWGRYRTDDQRTNDAAAFTTLRGRWTTAPTRVAPALLSASSPSSSTSTTRATRAATTVPATASTSGATNPVVEPTTVVWGGQLVSVTPMVEADRPALQEDLAALVTGTVEVDGRPLLRVLRAEEDVLSPGAARAALETAARQFVARTEGGADVVDVGELQPVEVAGGLVWVLPWYETAGTRLVGVAMWANGRVAVGRSVEGAARQLFGVEPGFTTRAEGTVTTPDEPARDRTPEELLAEADQLSRQATARLEGGDPTGAINLMREAYELAAEAASKRAVAPPTTTLPPTTTTAPPATTTVPTVNA